MRRYSRVMPSGVIDPPPAPRYAFDVLEGPSPGPGALRWRLQGKTRDGRWLLLDFGGDGFVAQPAAAWPATPLQPGATASTDPAPLPLPARLTRAVLEAIDDANGRRWQLQSDQGRFDLGAARLFVHEDVSAAAAIAVPPRVVPLGKRLFWRAVFALLATRSGRRWLERRAARA